MKYLIPGLLVLSIAVAFCCPITNVTEMTIRAPFVKVFTQLNTAENWMAWSRSAVSTGKPVVTRSRNGFDISDDGKSTSVKFLAPFGFDVYRTGNHYQVLLSVQKYDRSTQVTIRRTIKVFAWLFDNGKSRQECKALFARLKTYLEDPLSFHGLTFRKTTLDQMGMVVCDTVVEMKNRASGITGALNRIRSAVSADELAEKDKVYIRMVPYHGGYEFTVGVHVKMKLAPRNGLIYLEIPAMPAFIVHYEGPHTGIQEAYSDMESYLSAHEMKEVIAPIEKYREDNLPLTDRSILKTEIIFPSY